MTIQQITYFLMVAEYKSFTKAAEMAYISQPAISKQISLLESELGIVLFDRKYRSASLTPPGKMIYEMLVRHKQEFEDECSAAKHRYSDWRNSIWVGLTENINPGNLYEILGDFQKANPNLWMRVDVGAGRELAVSVTGEDYDLIVTPRLQSSERIRTETVTLYTGNYVMLISKKHPCYRKGLKASDLNGMPLYVAVPKSISREVYNGIKASHLDVSQLRMLPTADSVIGAVCSLSGVGVVNDLVFIPPAYNLEVITLDVPYVLEMAWRQENSNPHLPALREAIQKNIVINPDFIEK